MLILISDAFDATLPQLLAKYGDVTDDKSRAAEAEVVLIRSKTKVTKEYIDSAPNLKLVIRGGVGLDNVDQVYAKSKGIEVHNTADASTTAVAELAFSMMIALPNHTAKADQSMREGKWLKKELKRTELHGKTLGIVGMGRIGTALAVRARAFRMRILAWHPDVYFSDFAEIRSTLKEVMQESDYLSIHVPLLDETRGMINKETLANCKKGAYIINTGRSGCVNEEDVAQALKDGHLGGYATDVWLSDPPDGSPLFDAPNTLFSPHIGASTKENMTRIGEVADKIIFEYVNR
ncbi:MAG: hydroxyacid dehydrogenase [bacterium]|nr:hydroxyacid dehydrogenase [bacterium]